MSHHRRSFAESVGVTAGRQLGNYVIQRKIGAGSQGEVFLAQDVVLERKAALKVFPNSAESPYTRSLLREARLIAKLDTPTIVRVHHIERTQTLCYIAIEYVDGSSLDALVARSGPIPAMQAVNYGLAMCDGLSHAHALGIVHCDINPKNLLISRTGVLKIADFGLAFIWLSPSSMGRKEMRGTPLYMAPEVWRGEATSPQVDIYGLGACLYFMLTGRAPFVESDLEALRRAHLEQTVILPSRVPRALADIVQACMAKAPGDRPDSAVVISRALRDFIDDKQKRRRVTQATPIPIADGADGGDGEPDDDIVSEFYTDEFSELRASSLPEMQSGQAAQAMMALTPYASTIGGLGDALADEAPLVILHGGHAADRVQVGKHFFARDPRALPLLARIELMTEPGQLVQTLQRKLGMELPARSPNDTSDIGEEAGQIVKRLTDERREQRVENQPRGVLMHLLGAIDEIDAIGLAQLAQQAGLRDIKLVLSCSDANAQLVSQAAQAYELAARTVALAPATIVQVAKCFIVWIRTATGGRFAWSHDGLLLACDAVFDSDDGVTLKRIERLATNAVRIAANANMRLITSWCVSGATQHGKLIERAVDVQARWRRRPSAWPPPELLSKLSELRSKWPQIGGAASTVELDPPFERRD